MRNPWTLYCEKWVLSSLSSFSAFAKAYPSLVPSEARKLFRRAQHNAALRSQVLQKVFPHLCDQIQRNATSDEFAYLKDILNAHVSGNTWLLEEFAQCAISQFAPMAAKGTDALKALLALSMRAADEYYNISKSQIVAQAVRASVDLDGDYFHEMPSYLQAVYNTYQDAESRRGFLDGGFEAFGTIGNGRSDAKTAMLRLMFKACKDDATANRRVLGLALKELRDNAATNPNIVDIAELGINNSRSDSGVFPEMLETCIKAIPAVASNDHDKMERTLDLLDITRGACDGSIDSLSDVMDQALAVLPQFYHAGTSVTLRFLEFMKDTCHDHPKIAGLKGSDVAAAKGALDSLKNTMDNLALDAKHRLMGRRLKSPAVTPPPLTQGAELHILGKVTPVWPMYLPALSA